MEHQWLLVMHLIQSQVLHVLCNRFMWCSWMYRCNLLVTAEGADATFDDGSCNVPAAGFDCDGKLYLR